MLRNQDQDELRQIMSQTYANSSYVDEQIKHLLAPTQEEPILKHFESVSSRRSSQSSNHNIWRDELSLGSRSERPSFSEASPDKPTEKYVQPSEEAIHIFDDYYKIINRNLRPQTVEQVRQKYPLFLLSQPQYQIKNHIKEISLAYSGGLIRKNIVVMEAGYCEHQKVFKVAVGTDQGQVIIFEPNSPKPQQIIDCFGKICTVTSVRWSKNLQYLAISNDSKELKVYSFKQAIHIENQISFRVLKNPVEYVSLNEKQLKNIIVQLYFVDELPFLMILVDEFDRIIKLQMRKNYINMRPFLSEFEYKVSDYLDLSILSTLDEKKNKGAFMAIAGKQLVTLCMIQPTFEVAMVYDKEKHGGHIKKHGFPHVSFRENPTSLMVVWDKYLQIVDIAITSFSPSVYSFSIRHKFLLPDSTILAGFISNSLIYQVTRVGVKLYSVITFGPQISPKYESKQVHFQKIDYSQFCYGERIQDAISQNQVQLLDLRYIKGLFVTARRTLFYSSLKGVQMIYLSTLQEYLSYLVDNSNWKTALQILKNCQLGLVYQLDELQPQLITNKLKQLSLRYINFLQTIILKDLHTKEDNSLLLWNQELTFVFNILLATDLHSFLLQDVIPKVYQLDPSYIHNVIPFILTQRLTQVTAFSLQLFIQTLPRDVVSKLVFSLLPHNNGIELPHQINGLLIQHGLYLQMIDINQKFRDHYTPTAVLLGLYLKLELDNDRNIMEITQEKRNISRLLAYSVYDTLSAINFNKYPKNLNKQILGTLIPLLTDQITPIFIKEQPIALFQNIFDELYMGNCLECLNQLDLTNHEGDLMILIVNSIEYGDVVRFGCQKKYWMAVFKLYARKIIQVKVYQGLHFLCIQDHIEKVYIQKFVSKCEEQIVRELKEIPENVLNGFFQALILTDHVCLVKVVGKLLKRYIDTLEAMLKQESQQNANIFVFLDDCMPLLSSLQLQVLKTLLKENIQCLTDIDAGRTSDIICKYFLPDLQLFIDDLGQYQQQQLKLIHSVLQLYHYNESLLHLKVRYLELLAITDNHEAILQELMKESYPLDQSISICKKYDVLQAYAYLLVKSGGTGNIQSSIKVYFQIIWQEIMKILLHHYNSQEDLQQCVMYYVQKCIKICVELDLQDHQIEWFNIMEELQLLKKNIFKNTLMDGHICEVIKGIVNHKAYPQLIRMLITEVNYDNIIHYLRIKLASFDLEAAQIVILQMKKSCFYERGLKLILQDIFIDSENQLRKRLLRKQLKGFATPDICDVCNSKGGLLVHYKCGHEIHPSCGQDVRECVICLQDVQVIYEKRIDQAMKVKVDIYSRGITGDLEEVEQQLQKESNLRKMGLFDELLDYSLNFDI